MWILEILLLLALTGLNGLLAMSEMAVVSSSRPRLLAMAERGRRGAAAAVRLLEDPSRFLSTIQIGITLIGIAAGAFGGATLGADVGRWLDDVPWIAPYGEVVGFVAVVAAITYVSLVVGELVPKRIALGHAEAIAARVAGTMERLARIASPAVWVLRLSTEAIVRVLRLNAPAREEQAEEQEIRLLLAEGTRSGTFDPDERRMVEGVLRLADRSVRTIMTPRTEIVWVDAENDVEAQKATLRGAAYSRIPVCRGSIDELLVVVRAKDLMDRLLDGRSFDLLAIGTQPLVVPEGATAQRLLQLFRSSQEHLAVVVDEYGGVVGLATLTDVMEAIAGDLPERGEDAAERVTRRPDGSWLLDGGLAIDEVEIETGLSGMKGQGESFETLAGFLLWHLRRLPVTGDRLQWQDAAFEIVDMDGKRIDKVLVSRQPRGDPEGS